MGKSIYTICLDLQNVDSQTTLYAKQGDTDRIIHFTLRDGGKAFELKDTDILVLSTITPGGKTIEESVEIKNGTAVYEFSEYLTASIGAMNVELRIYSEGKNVISASFTLVVEARNGVAKSVTEQDSFTALDTVYAQAQKAIEDAEIATTSAYNASVRANAAAEVANEAAESANNAADHAESAASDATQATESANNAVTSVGGAIEEARHATSAAASAAEDATSAANNADEKAYLASDAAQFANIESQGAIEAAKKANDAAKRANDAIDRLENEGLNIDKSLFANAIADSKSGTVVVLTDVSPFEHTLGVRARYTTPPKQTYTVESSNEYYVSITDADLFVQKTIEAGFTYEPNEMVEFSLGLVTDDAPYPLYYNGNKIMDVDENCGLTFPELTNNTIYITVYSHLATAEVYQLGKNLFELSHQQIRL